MNGVPCAASVSNVGNVDVSDLEITLSGQVTTENRSKNFVLERLQVGASVDASFFVRAQEAGAQVPVHLDLAYSGPVGATTARRPGL